jgi:U3 small nucleolar RNA-associated protein MPP10
LEFAARELYASDSDDEIMSGNAPKYSDFFGGGGENSESGDDNEEEDDEGDEEEEEEEEEDDEEEDDEEEEEEEEASNEESDQSEKEEESAPQTNYQRRKEALRSQIEELEQQTMATKDWELRGEVKSRDRPENSLLAVSADIERYYCQ